MKSQLKKNLKFFLKLKSNNYFAVFAIVLVVVGIQQLSDDASFNDSLIEERESVLYAKIGRLRICDEFSGNNEGLRQISNIVLKMTRFCNIFYTFVV